jgi:L-arabinose isomerase
VVPGPRGLLGYDDVMASEDALALLGVREKCLGVSDLDSALGDIDDGKATALLGDLGRRANWHLDDHPENLRSARLAIALEALMRRHAADCGTVNCHSAFFRNNPNIGITACLGVSLLAERGIPVSCTGDLPAALSMFVAELLSGRALYCEAYTAELETGLMLIAAGGEGDPRWAGPQGIKVVANNYYKGCHGAGASLSFLLEPGPATLISMSPSERGWKLAWGTGEISAGRYEEMDGPNRMLRFDRTPVDEAVSAWISSGATHHHALARGRLDFELRIVAGALGIEAVPV